LIYAPGFYTGYGVKTIPGVREAIDYAKAAAAEGKPAPIIEKIVHGKIESFYQESVLLRQNFIRDDSMTVEDLIKAAIAKLNENIVVRRFARFEIGEA
jgi:elongation factor Ts